MTLDQFLDATRERLPSPAELLAVCDTVGVSFALDPEGHPVLRPGPGSRDVAVIIAGLLKREPWRSHVIAARDLRPPESPPPVRAVELLWRSGYVGRHHFPEQGYPVGCGWWRYEGEGGGTWRPIPGRELQRGESPQSWHYETERLPPSDPPSPSP